MCVCVCVCVYEGMHENGEESFFVLEGLLDAAAIRGGCDKTTHTNPERPQRHSLLCVSFCLCIACVCAYIYVSCC
jgi:hypothetical protein